MKTILRATLTVILDIGLTGCTTRTGTAWEYKLMSDSEIQRHGFPAGEPIPRTGGLQRINNCFRELGMDGSMLVISGMWAGIRPMQDKFL
ncbi:MAG: hypothetical protein JXL20_05515 [Deltaproteobacteria bacterium]|nr:hypothetical protein [Deltaproteobacteria bacterium]MBN2783798.1 hypothetical protein [Pontiellaceae bacterium]